MGHTLRLTVTLLVACGSCATLICAALLYAGPAFPAAEPRPAATATTLRTSATPRIPRIPRIAGILADPAISVAAGPGERAGHADVDRPVGQPIDPALFSPGACQAFAPTSGNLHETVFLDAGHGGMDPGAVGTTQTGAPVNESAANLAVELDTMAILRAEGYRVVVSRTENSTVTKLTAADVDGRLLTVRGVLNDVGARDVCANLADADVLVGIYMDSGSPQDAGCVTGYDAVRPFSSANLRLATLLQDDVLSAMNTQGWGIPSEGVQPDTVLGSALDKAALAYGHLILLGPARTGYFTTPSQMPGALIEPLFVTDPFEGSIAASADGQQVIATALAQAITQYFA
jgi:N-acetylmuramoyl-L-alanine amidase